MPRPPYGDTSAPVGAVTGVDDVDDAVSAALLVERPAVLIQPRTPPDVDTPDGSSPAMGHSAGQGADRQRRARQELRPRVDQLPQPDPPGAPPGGRQRADPQVD